MKFVRIYLVAFLCVCLSGCASAVKVKPVGKMKKIGSGGIFYSLPETIFVAEVELKLTQQIPADPECAKYTSQLFGVKPKETKSKILSISSVRLTSAGRKDLSRTFFARIQQDPFSTHSSTFALQPDGILTNGKSESKNLTMDYIVETLEVAASLAATGATAASAITPASDQDDQIDEKKKAFDVEGGGGSNESKKNGKPLPVPVVPPGIQALKDEIDDLLAHKTSIYANSGPKAIELLDRLEKEIKTKMTKFVGGSKTTSATMNFIVTPPNVESGCEESVTLFTYNSGGCVQICGNLRNKAPDFVETVSSVLPNVLGISFARGPVPEAAGVDLLAANGRPEGIYYCIPGSAEVSVYDRASALSKAEVMIAQYGVDSFLPAKTGSQKTTVEAQLDPATGALIKATIGGQAFDPKYVERVGNAANEAYAADLKRNAQDPAKSQKEKLEEEVAILKLQQERQELRQSSSDDN